MTTFNPRPKFGLAGPGVGEEDEEVDEEEEDDDEEGVDAKKISTSSTQSVGPFLPLLAPLPVEMRNPRRLELQPVVIPQTGFSMRL